jgi:hypothetical protein
METFLHSRGSDLFLSHSLLTTRSPEKHEKLKKPKTCKEEVKGRKCSGFSWRSKVSATTWLGNW